MSDQPTKAQESLRDTILAERDKGNLVFAHLEGYSAVSIEDFVKQPVDGMLYDLNRGEEVSLSFITEKKWVNDFAVALVIRKLVEQRDAARSTEAVDEWTPLSKQRPSPHIQVLFTDGELYSTGYIDQQGLFCMDINHESDPPMSPTHWMPCPTAPVERADVHDIPKFLRRGKD